MFDVYQLALATCENFVLIVTLADNSAFNAVCFNGSFCKKKNADLDPKPLLEVRVFIRLLALGIFTTEDIRL